MAQKTLPSPLSPKADVRIDYALIATGIAAALIALLISSTVVLRAATKLKSTNETLMVGTRIAKPSI